MQAARWFRQLADVLDQHTAFTLSGVDVEAPHAMLVVLFDQQGCPTPTAIGFGGMTHADFLEAVRDAEQALIETYAPYRVRFAGQDEPPATEQQRRSAAVESWRDRDTTRRKLRAEKEAQRAAFIAERPFECDCGFRAKSAGGLATHRRGRRHRPR